LLRLSNPRVVEKYSQLLHEKLSYYKAYESTENLPFAAEVSKWQNHHTAIYHILDNIVTQSMIHAEKQLGNRPTKGYQCKPFSASAFGIFASKVVKGSQ
jgi:hypothetical protein